MAFLNIAEAVSTSANTLYTVPAGREASVHALFFNNPTGSTETITISLFNQGTGLTLAINTEILVAAADYVFPKPLNLSTGDKIIVQSTGAGTIVTASVYSQLVSGVDPTLLLNPRGTWDTDESYLKLDMVARSGSSYVAINPNAADQPPSVNWMIVADNGAGALSNVVEDVTPQFGGNIDFNGNSAVGSSYVQAPDVSVGTGTHTFNYAIGDSQQVTATGNITIAFSNFTAGRTVSYMIDAVNWGDNTITLPVGMLFDTGAAPAFTEGGADKLMIIKDKDEVYSMFIIGQALASV